MALGDYVKTTFVEGSAPGISAARLNNHENKTAELDAAQAAHLADFVRQPGYGLTAGGTLAYLLTLSPVPTSYADGMGISAKINVTNTGTTTINVNSLGVKTIKNPDGTDLIAGDLVAGGIYSLKYNSTTSNFILVGKGGGPNKAGSNTVFTVSTADQAITKGYYPGNLTDGKVKGEAQLLASNLPVGVTIGGVVGTGVNAKRVANGTQTSTSGTSLYTNNGGGTVACPSLTVTGLTFLPSSIVVYKTVGAGTIYEAGASFNFNSSQCEILLKDSSSQIFTYQKISPVSIISGSFTIPVDSASTSYTWKARE